MKKYPKRLIEVDLPIKRISAHARREKSIRHGHISTLHIWWARRPLAACRAVLCASLWPDPADELCPDKFRKDATKLINVFANNVVQDKDLTSTCSEESFTKWITLSKSNLDPTNNSHLNILRFALLDFIADFANWDNSTNIAYLDTSRALTQSAHEALGGVPGTKPLVVDPFAGGGSIPLEALRVGADAFASDLNPVAVLLNKVVLEYIPKYGQKLADEVKKWGEWVKQEAEKELAEFYPKDPDGSTPIAYLWARTIQCEGPGCGAEVPLMRSMWLAKKTNKSVSMLKIPRPDLKKVDFAIIRKEGKSWVVQEVSEDEENRQVSGDRCAIKVGDIVVDPDLNGTVARGSATCPCCGYTTNVISVSKQLRKFKGGANSAKLFTVILLDKDNNKKHRLPLRHDYDAVIRASKKLSEYEVIVSKDLSFIPNESLPPHGALGFRIQRYGMVLWRDIYSDRQLLSLSIISSIIRKLNDKIDYEIGFKNSLITILSFILDRQADYLTSLTVWSNNGQFIAHTFGRQAMPIVWEWPECNLFANGSGNWDGAIDWIYRVIIANTF